MRFALRRRPAASVYLACAFLISAVAAGLAASGAETGSWIEALLALLIGPHALLLLALLWLPLALLQNSLGIGVLGVTVIAASATFLLLFALAVLNVAIATFIGNRIRQVAPLGRIVKTNSDEEGFKTTVP